MSPTLTSAGTVAGMMLGTAAYMSPEQARGQAADKRADIWAFGCLFHEMLTGTRAFPGGTVTDTLAAVLTLQPDAVNLPVETPRSIRKLIDRCTQKDVRRRLRDIGEARIAIEDAQADPGDATLRGEETASGHGPRPRAPWLVAAITGAVAVAAIALLVFQRDAPEPSTGRCSIQFPYSAAPRYGDGRALAISPDGKFIISSAEGGSDDQLYIRRIDDFTVREIATARSARLPFFSPAVSTDGRWLAYVSDQAGRDEVYVTRFPNPSGIVQVSVAGGANPTWSPDGSELFYFQDRQFIAVTIAYDPEIRVVSRTTLFEGDFVQYRWQRQYDVHPDGEHFVMVEDPPGSHLEVVLNWFTELNRTVARND